MKPTLSNHYNSLKPKPQPRADVAIASVSAFASPVIISVMRAPLIALHECNWRDISDHEIQSGHMKSKNRSYKYADGFDGERP